MIENKLKFGLELNKMLIKMATVIRLNELVRHLLPLEQELYFLNHLSCLIPISVQLFPIWDSVMSSGNKPTNKMGYKGLPYE